ncbi:YqcI/YcgG family protein [Aurantibacter sp.]|uniref:YqcI/YcgG family protein n=1 Tax=Aurantibacter sp. TaxID=2807103 RepID=UPI003266A41D
MASNASIDTLEQLDKIEQDFKNFVLKQKHPCVMAKSVFKMEHFHLNIYDDVDADSAIKLLNDLEDYIAQYDFESNQFESFLAVFPNTIFVSELAFEKGLWKLLQILHDFDDCVWDSAVSDNPNSPKFSFSLKINNTI